MTELMRPALYGAYHRIVPVTPREGDVRSYEIVGPLCESSDIFGRDRQLPALEVDDVMAILDAGAYGSVMASTYNRRPLLAEVLIDDEAPRSNRDNRDVATPRSRDGAKPWRVIRRRQTIDELLSTEI